MEPVKPRFIPGLELAGRFYRQAVRPILQARFPGLAHGAALLGSGSEVLGFDTPVSTDHHWGPRVMLFVREEDEAACTGPLLEALRQGLPHRFLDWPTSFTLPGPDDGVCHLDPAASGPVNHRVEVLTLRGFLRDELGFDLREPLTVLDWLGFPSQRLRTITAGAVFHDEVGLQEARQRFAWYPQDVWLYLLAAGWTRIGEEEHLLGRAGQAGDELGSALIGARLVRDVMRLCFLMERDYAPYPKWYGTAFARLKAAGPLDGLLWQVLRAQAWPERDRALGEATSVLATMHNALGLTDPLPAAARTFAEWNARPDRPAPLLAAEGGRPFHVISGERFARALRARILDPEVRSLPFPIGGIDQWTDSTEVLEETRLRAQVKALYRRAR